MIGALVFSFESVRNGEGGSTFEIFPQIVLGFPLTDFLDVRYFGEPFI